MEIHAVYHPQGDDGIYICNTVIEDNLLFVDTYSFSISTSLFNIKLLLIIVNSSHDF